MSRDDILTTASSKTEIVSVNKEVFVQDKQHRLCTMYWIKGKNDEDNKRKRRYFLTEIFSYVDLYRL